MANRILENRAQCAKCKDIITSHHRHDFKFCKCKTIAVDGGKVYLRRLFNVPDDLIELSTFLEG